MNYEALFTLISWSAFLFVWLPLRRAKHLRVMRSLRAINKGSRTFEKYRLLKRLCKS